MKRSNQIRKKNFNVQFEKKRSIRKFNGVKSSAQGNEKFIEKPDAKCNKGSDLRARAHPTKLPACEIGLKKSLRVEGNHQQEQADAPGSSRT